MDVHSIVSNHRRTNEPTQKTFRQRQRNFSIPKILLFSALYNQIELLLFHRFLSAGNCTLGENKFNPSARLDAPHSEALFFNYRSVLLCPGEGGDVWHAAGSQQLQPAALEPIQQQLVSSLQLAPKFKRRPVLQMQSGGWKQWGRRRPCGLLGRPWCGSQPRARGQTSLLRNEAQRSGICSLSFPLPPADAFQGKEDCFQGGFTLSLHQIIRSHWLRSNSSTLYILTCLHSYRSDTLVIIIFTPLSNPLTPTALQARCGNPCPQLPAGGGAKLTWKPTAYTGHLLKMCSNCKRDSELLPHSRAVMHWVSQFDKCSIWGSQIL